MKIIMYMLVCYMVFPVAIAMGCESINGSIVCSQDISFAVTDTGQITNGSVEVIPLSESNNVIDNSSNLPETEFYSTKSSLVQVVVVLIGISLLILSIYYYVNSTKAQS